MNSVFLPMNRKPNRGVISSLPIQMKEFSGENRQSLMISQEFTPSLITVILSLAPVLIRLVMPSMVLPLPFLTRSLKPVPTFLMVYTLPGTSNAVGRVTSRASLVALAMMTDSSFAV